MRRTLSDATSDLRKDSEEHATYAPSVTLLHSEDTAPSQFREQTSPPPRSKPTSGLQASMNQSGPSSESAGVVQQSHADTQPFSNQNYCGRPASGRKKNAEKRHDKEGSICG